MTVRICIRDRKERKGAATLPDRLVASNNRSPLAGLRDLPAERVPVPLALSVNSTGISLSSQFRPSSELGHPTGLIPSSSSFSSSSYGSVAHMPPSVTSTKPAVPTVRTFSLPDIPCTSFPQSATNTAPKCKPNCWYSCYLNRKRRLSCSIANYDQSTIASVEKYHKLL